MSVALISIVVPCHNEEDMIPLFIKQVEAVKDKLDPYELEYIFIDDGSKDNTLNILKRLSIKMNTVKYISFSRNFGKESALYAGLNHAAGEYVVVMDVDLQDPPSLLPEMLSYLEDDDYDCVGTRRINRTGEPAIRSFFARQFYKIINAISETEIVDGARDYRMMTRQMVDAILSVSEYNRFSKGIFSWVGFKTKYIEFKNIPRAAGETTWSFWSLVRYSLDGIVAFSEVPLSIASFIGLLTFIVSIILALMFTFRTLFFDNPTSGWTSLMVMMLGLSGIQLFSLGILGKYLGKTFLEVKKRPLFIIKESNSKEFDISNRNEG